MPLCPCCFRVPLLKLRIRKKGTLIIKGRGGGGRWCRAWVVGRLCIGTEDQKSGGHSYPCLGVLLVDS